jgi:D-serine deaminase-like pyridoxal phosphate-dependent protein
MGPDPLDQQVDYRFKGFAPGVYGRRLSGLVRDRVNLFDGTFSPPITVLKHSALQHNIDTMGAYCRDHGVDLAPHGKTTLAPQLFERQLAAGAWGISAATPAQVALCRAAGVPRVLLANELVDQAAIAWIIGELARDPSFDFLCYVDSIEGVRLLEHALQTEAPARPLDVLIEMGPVGGRTGCRSMDHAREVARAASTIEGLRVVGVAGYEGGIGHELTDTVLHAVREFLQLVHETAAELARERLVVDRGDGIVLSAGGSIFFDEAATVLSAPLPGGYASRCVLRPGAYVSHDSGLYERLSPFTRPGADPGYTLHPALEAWGQVLSKPEPGLAIASIGRRDVPADQGLPSPLRIRRPGVDAMIDARTCSVTELNDQHAFIAVPHDFDLRAGDWLSFGISHPCTSFDKWHLLPEVNDDDIVINFIRTYF